MPDASDDLQKNTQASRRLKYGLNVAVAALAAVGLVVLINWIAYREYLRFDFTATRQYSFAQQTRQVLRQLEGDYQIVGLFGAYNEHLQHLSDLIAEYGRYAPNLRVQHIDPGQDVAAREAFFAQLRQRFESDLTPLAQGIEQGRQGLRQVIEATTSLLPSLRQMAENPELGEGPTKQFIEAVVAALRKLQTQIDPVDERIQQQLTDALPNYSSIRADVESILRQVDQNVLAVAVDRFRKTADSNDAPAAVKNEALRIADQMDQVRQSIRDTLKALEQNQTVDRYDQIRGALEGEPSVVVMGPKQVRIIPVQEMFREPDPEMVRQTGRREPLFLGEERLTGALLSLSLEQPPLVVFVSTGRTPVLGSQSAESYEFVAQRLRSANFDVQEWNPAGRMTSFGQPMPPGPAPEPKPGQRAIWIILPLMPSNPMNPMAGGGAEQVAELLQRRLPQGDTAMILLTVNPMAQFGQPDPIVELVESWGITPQTDRIILHEVQLPNRRTAASSQFNVDRWPQDLAITEAMRGMPAVFLQASPLTLEEASSSTSTQPSDRADDADQSADSPQVKHYPLVRLEAQRMWAQTNIYSSQDLEKARFDEALSAASYLIGVAAQRGDDRLIVFTDPVWASNNITTYGLLGPGTAELVGSLFPGNSELFVNCVYWLAGLDQLIAASPRTQDIRRIEPITDGALRAYHWLLMGGMPAAVAVAGVGVWLVRRKG